MMKVANTTRSIYKTQAKQFAGGKKKHVIDPHRREFDCIWIGGLNSANMIKYFQHKHFHGELAGFNGRPKFFNEHLYEYLITSNMKGYKYLAMPFSSNFEVTQAKCAKERIAKIEPEKNQVITEKGEVYKYNALVLNTGTDLKVNKFRS